MGLPFEKPIEDLEAKIADMRGYSQEQGVSLDQEIGLLEGKLEQLKKDTFAGLSRWQRVQVAGFQVALQV